MITRRALIAITACGSLFPAAGARSAAAAEDRLGAEIALFALGRSVEPANFGFSLPDAIESGYTVPVSLESDGAATAGRIVALRILAPLNPLVRVASFELGPMSAGRLETRIRLARTQVVTGLARTADGRILRQDVPVSVLVGGCGFDLEVPT